jgi:hypothetical protein
MYRCTQSPTESQKEQGVSECRRKMGKKDK